LPLLTPSRIQGLVAANEPRQASSFFYKPSLFHFLCIVNYRGNTLSTLTVDFSKLQQT